MPSIAERGVMNAVGDIKSLFEESQRIPSELEAQGFSASKYFFVSQRVAKALKASKVADVIIGFHSVRPKRPYGHTSSSLKSSVMFLVFFVLLNLPPQYQNCLVKFLLAIMLGSMAGAASSYGVFAVGALCLIVLCSVHGLLYFYDALLRCRHSVAPISTNVLVDAKGDSGNIACFL